MDADHKKHNKQDTFATVDSKRTFGQSVPIEACVGFQPNREFHKVMHIYRPYSTKKTQYSVKKSRSISKVTSWRDKRLYCIQKVNLSPRPTEVDLSTLPE